MCESSARELVDKIIAREPGAEDELVRRYRRGLHVILSRATGDPAIVDDLSQETFRITLEKLRRGELREPDRLSGFILSLARNLASLYFRQVRRSKLVGENEAREVRNEEPNQLEHLLNEEKVRLVRQVLNELGSERDREILYRFYIAEEDKDRICADMKLSSLHFNRVLYRARERYKKLFQQSQERERDSRLG